MRICKLVLFKVTIVISTRFASSYKSSFRIDRQGGFKGATTSCLGKTNKTKASVLNDNAWLLYVMMILTLVVINCRYAVYHE